jgi:HAD domain in Swiss Army Knife RNA repair proteins
MQLPAHSRPPILAVDVDGVISLFGFEEPPERAPCKFQLIDGMAHCISLEVGERLRRLIPYFEMVWATGWEDRANEYLLHLLGLQRLPVIHFGRDAEFGSAHWKLGPIEAYAQGRSLAWIDDSLDDECRQWGAARPEPTLLVETRPEIGLQEAQVELLIQWATAGSPPSG